MARTKGEPFRSILLFGLSFKDQKQEEV